MKEIVTVFSCLLLTPITDSNISILLFIALIVAFFLIGLIFGLIINPRRKRKEKKLGNEEQKDKLQEPNPPDLQAHNNLMNENSQRQAPNTRGPGSRYYNNYW